MAFVVLDELASEVSSEITSILGVPPPAWRQPAQPPAPITSNQWLQLTNEARVALGVGPLPANAPQTQVDYDTTVNVVLQTLAFNLESSASSITFALGNITARITNVANLLGTMATNAAGSAQNNAIGVAQNLYNQAIAYTNGQIAALATTVNNLHNATENELAADVKALANFAVQQRAGAEGYTNQQINAVNATIKADVATLTQFAVDQRAGAEGYTNQVADAIRTDLANDVTMLEQRINNGVQEAEDFALQVANQAEANAVTQVKAAFGPPLDRITTELKTCLDPLCDTVTPNAPQLGRLGSLLKGMEGLGLAALLAALVAEAIADPRAAAGQMEAAAGWTDGLALGLVNAVVG